MSKVTMSIEELIKLVKGDLPNEQVKKNIAAALMEVWLNNPEVMVRIEGRAEELVERKVKAMIDSAFKEEKPSLWNGQKASFSGWAAKIIEHHFNEAMGASGLMKGKPLREMAEDVVRKYGDEYNRAWRKTLEDAIPFIDQEVRKLIPQYVTNEYKERVAAHFDEKKMGALLEEMVTKAIGGMLMSGALSFNGSKQS